MINAIGFLMLIQLFFSSCSTSKKNITEGVVVLKDRVYDSTLKTLVIPTYFKDRKCWYKDSLIILEGFGVKMHTDITGKHTWSAYTDRFTYMDLYTNNFYVYKNFSDTANIRESYNLDTKDRPSDGWDVTNDKYQNITNDLFKMPDTNISGLNYKRFRRLSKKKIVLSEEHSNQDSIEIDKITIYYGSESYSNFLVCLNRVISKKVGVPILRVDVYFPSLKSLSVIEMEILSNKLSDDEKKVFRAWSKNAARRSPVVDK